MSLLFRRKDEAPRKSLWQRIKDVALTDVAVLAKGGVDTGSLFPARSAPSTATWSAPRNCSCVLTVPRVA